MINPTPTLLKGAMTLGVIALLTPLLFKVYILACMYWTLNVQSNPSEPWDGCADPTSQAELNAWIAHSKAAGEPMCDPEIVNMTFDEPAPNSEP